MSRSWAPSVLTAGRQSQTFAVADEQLGPVGAQCAVVGSRETGRRADPVRGARNATQAGDGSDRIGIASEVDADGGIRPGVEVELHRDGWSGADLKGEVVGHP